MIRVNLLPKDERVHKSAPTQFKAGEYVIPVVIVVATAAVVAGTSVAQRMATVNLSKSIVEVESQSRALAPQIERVNRLAQEKAELDLRMGIIGRLQEGRTSGVRVMDELARCVPEHLWLSSATQDGGTVLNLQGTTFSNLVVSDFMSRLERSPMFSAVTLESAERGEIDSRPVVKFTLHCTITPNEQAN
jgi:type IV pilus assembly protein PilN